MECIGDCNKCTNGKCVCAYEDYGKDRNYRLKNIDRLRENQRKYYAKNREKILEKQKEYRDIKKI